MWTNTMKTNEEHNKRGEEDGLHFRTGYGKVYGLEKMGLTETNCFHLECILWFHSHTDI